MSLIKILTQMFEQFLPTLVCVVPISFAIGTIVGTPLVRLINKLYPSSRENREGAKEQFLYDWLELLVGAFLCGFLTFPIAERISGGTLTLWESVGVAICLLIFALLTPIMAAKTIEGKDERTTRNKLISFWAGLAGGGILGALFTLQSFRKNLKKNLNAHAWMVNGTDYTNRESTFHEQSTVPIQDT